MTGLIVTAVVLVVAGAFGLYRLKSDGRLRTTEADGTPALTEGDLGAPLGSDVTIVQFCTSFCTNCPGTWRMLEEVTSQSPGVALVAVDAETRLDLVETFHVRRTPTVLFLDSDGLLHHRTAGPPRKADVVALLDALT